MEQFWADLEFVYVDFPWFFWILVFVFGAIVGSFLNVCIYRIPAGRSVIYPSSRGADGEPIAWYDNIPILSWFILGGKSRATRKPYSFRYPFVEALTAGLFLWSWLALPPDVAVAGWVLIAFMICATFIDLDHMIIPDRFSVGGMLLGVLLAGLIPAMHGELGIDAAARARSVVSALQGALIGSASVYWLATLASLALRKEAMGEGDVKLVGAIGAFCGWQGGVFALFGGATLGSIVLLPIMLYQAIFKKKPSGVPSPKPIKDDKPTDRSDIALATEPTEEDEGLGIGMAVPFGPMLAAAGVLYFLWLHQPVDAYFEMIAELISGSF